MRGKLDDDLLGDLAEPEGPAYPHAADEGDLGDLGDPLAADLLEANGAGDGLEFEAAEATDELGSTIADVLGADDADFGGVAKKVPPIISQVAPLLPIPGAGLIGNAADIVSQVATDQADALEGIIDIADEAD